MANDELLAQIGTLIESKLKAEREQTRKLVREEVEAVEKRLTSKRDTVDLKVEAVQEFKRNHKS
jgi:hypothetical protein